MLRFPADTKNEAKCNATHGIMGHLDPKQPPVKRKPFVSILNHNFIQKVELLLPKEIYEIIRNDFFTECTQPGYSRVILPLSALLEGEFFNEYIKKGNILMLSEGRPGVDKVYSLREGILTLYLDKESYERAGLVGKPDGVKGKRGTKPRWVVEINLRLPSMLHGKKGFDRIVYACKNVLSAPVTWLFCDLGTTAMSPDPLDMHFPTKVTIAPEILLDIKTSIPPLKPIVEPDTKLERDFEDFAVDTLEWLALVSLNSPRIDPNDKIDPFLCRYVSPGESNTTCSLVKISWQGFMAPSWAHKTFVQTLLAVPGDAWFAFSVVGFGEGISGAYKDSTILKISDTANEYVLWEVAQ